MLALGVSLNLKSEFMIGTVAADKLQADQHFTLHVFSCNSAAADKWQVSQGPEVQASFNLMEDDITRTSFNMTNVTIHTVEHRR